MRTWSLTYWTGVNNSSDGEFKTVDVYMFPQDLIKLYETSSDKPFAEFIDMDENRFIVRRENILLLKEKIFGKDEDNKHVEAKKA